MRSTTGRRCRAFDRCRCGAVVLIFTAIVISGGIGPVLAGQQQATDLSDLFSAPGAIPGTEAYHLQQTGREISAFVSDLEAVEDARVVLRQAGDGRLGGLITVRLRPKAVWNRPLSDAIVGIITTCAPSVTLQALKIIDQRGRVLYSSGSAHLSDAGSPRTAGSGSNNSVNVALIVIAGIFLGFIAAGAWWLWGRSASTTTSEPADEAWAFLKEADPEALAEAFAGLRPEMVGAVTAGLDESTRSHVLSCLPANDAPDLSPTDQMHPEVEARLRQIMRDRMPS